MDQLRTQTSLLAAVIATAIVASVVMRPRRQRVHWMFGLFGIGLASWYLTTFLDHLTGDPVVERINLVCAVALPLSAVQFFRAFLNPESRPSTYLNRVALIWGATMVVLAFTPVYDHILLRALIFTYVLVLLAVVVMMLYARGQEVTSRFEAARLRYLAVMGAMAALFTLLDYLPLFGLDIPPVGTVLTLVFLYILSQSILRYRLLDLYELAGRLAVLTALSFALALIFWVVVQLADERFFLHAVVAALVVLLVFDPVRSRVEDRIARVFFRERHALERAVVRLRRQVANVFELDQLAGIVLSGLESTRRLTHASMYLVDEDRRSYSLAGHLGPEPPRRIDRLAGRPFLERLSRDGVVVIEEVESELADAEDDRERETLSEVIQALTSTHAGVAAALLGEQGDVYGILFVRDERLRDAFSPEEVQLLRGLAAQAAIAVENSRLYQRMKERDRLAALGQMAAGLAHEIRNPLGAIKASAQFLEEPGAPEDNTDGAKEFLGIIVEEVDRLNRVVESFLDYARPSSVVATPTDVNAALDRTMQLLDSECRTSNVTWTLTVDENAPNVHIDPERLRQVIINLVKNALQAMATGGTLGLETHLVEDRDVSGRERRWLDIRVRDSGPGIAPSVQSSLFVPFVTTKERGTGLGLAVSHRIVSEAGGVIDVRSSPGKGTTFIVRLPAEERPEAGMVLMTDQPPELEASEAFTPVLPPLEPSPDPSTEPEGTGPGSAPGPSEPALETPTVSVTKR